MRFSTLIFLIVMSMSVLCGQVTTIGSSGITNGASPLTLTNQLSLTANQTWTTVGPLTATGYVSSNNKNLTLDGGGTITFTNQLNGLKNLTLIGSGNRNFNVITGLDQIIIQNTGTNVFSGTVNTKKLLMSNGTSTFNGTVNSQNQGIIITGPSNATFNGEINSGNNGISINGSGNIVFNGRINSAGSLTIDGGADVTLSGTGQNNIGNTFVNNGTLIMDQTGGIAINGPLTVGSSGTVQFEGDSQTPHWQDVTLQDGATLLLGDTDQTFSNLIIEGDSIIDFGTGGSSLHIGGITVVDGALLTIANWNNMVDFFTSSSNPNDTVIQVYFSDTGQYGTWDQYGGFIRPGGSPVPEPSTYGFLMVGGIISLILFRRSYYNKR